MAWLYKERKDSVTGYTWNKLVIMGQRTNDCWLYWDLTVGCVFVV